MNEPFFQTTENPSFESCHAFPKAGCREDIFQSFATLQRIPLSSCVISFEMYTYLGTRTPKTYLHLLGNIAGNISRKVRF